MQIFWASGRCSEPVRKSGTSPEPVPNQSGTNLARGDDMVILLKMMMKMKMKRKSKMMMMMMMMMMMVMMMMDDG